MPDQVVFTVVVVGLFVHMLAANAREIVFPPISGYNGPVNIYGSQSPFDTLSHKDYLTDIPYRGLTTYANLPYQHCLSNSTAADVSDEGYDIAILGAPFDTATTGRPGARFGPGGIRQGSRRIDPESSYDVETDCNVFQEWARIVDCGDAPLTFLDNTVALKQLEESHRRVTARMRPSLVKGSASRPPRVVTLGGDHTTTLAALRVTKERWGVTTVIHFDSHVDTWQPKVIGGGLSHYAGVNHGTFLHVAHEEGLISNRSIHAGIRAPVFRPVKDRRNDGRCGFSRILAKEIDHSGVKGVVENIKERVGSDNVYISVDIDVLDPAFAPATGTAEVGGWSTREFLAILDGLQGLKVIGADLVEVAPVYDNPGETTVLAAAEIVKSLLKLMVVKPTEA